MRTQIFVGSLSSENKIYRFFGGSATAKVVSQVAWFYARNFACLNQQHAPALEVNVAIVRLPARSLRPIRR
ncbi:hypothetical protein [Sphingobium yanoikuyae]|uniref:hypothetical protein n=1 Tax=Sphingobium yanoikuyae TaxID=13690 RepID=UPI003EFE88C9